MRICEVIDMLFINENFGVKGATMGNSSVKCVIMALLFLIAIFLPWQAEAGGGTYGKVYNISVDTGTLDNAPIFSITTYPATFKIRAKVIDQTGAPVTGLTSSELIVHSVKNASTGALLTAGPSYVLGTFSEVSAGVYDRIITLNSGALTTGSLGQIEVRVTGASVDNQWLAATVFVKNGAYNYDAHSVSVQPQSPNGVIPGIHDYTSITLTARLASPWAAAASPLGWNTGTWSIKEIRDDLGNLVPLGLPNGVYFQHDYYSNDMKLSNIHHFMTVGRRYYINLISNLGYKEFMISVGLTAVPDFDYLNTPSIPVPSFASPIFFPATYIVNNGDKPVQNTAVGPGTAYAKLNSFMLSTFVGTDTLTGVTVELPHGSAAAIGLIEIAKLTNQGRYGGVIGSLANPETDIITVPVSSDTILDVNNINVVNNNYVYSVRITPKSHADMLAPPGSTYVMTGKVTSITHSMANNTLIFSSNDTSTITIDNTSPANPSWNMITPSTGQMSLSWVNPADADFSQIVILRSSAPVTDVPAEGGIYSVGSVIGTSSVACVTNKPVANCIDAGLASTESGYYYRLFAKDTNGNYSAGGTGSGPHILGRQTTPGTCTAVATTPTALTVTMPYTDDANENNSYTVEYKLSTTGNWTAWGTSAPHTASPYTTTITALSPGAKYDVRCTYLDSDGVDLQNQQLIAIVMPDNRTTAGTISITAASTTSIAVTIPYTTDYNGNNSITVDYQSANGRDIDLKNWITAAPHADSPYSTTITGLEQGQAYRVMVTYLDDDGVLGNNPQTTDYVQLADDRSALLEATAIASGSTTIKVDQLLYHDANGNGTVTVEYRKSGDVLWTNYISNAPHPTTVSEGGYPPATHYVTTLSGLVSLTAYDIRLTYQDPDGVLEWGGTAEKIFYNVMTLSNKLIHNSLNANRKGYWSQYNGWGIKGGQYGEFTCLTCHEKRSTNASGIRTSINLFPIGGSNNFGGPVRYDGPTGTFSFGDDSAVRQEFPPSPYYLICHVCHTQTTSMEGPPPYGPIHRKVQPQTMSHFNNQDCTRCHTHDNGFAAGRP